MNIDFDTLFNAVDQSDTEKFLEFLSEDAIFKFANMPTVEGKDDIRAFLNGYFSAIDHTQHSDLEIEAGESGKSAYVKGDVEYTRKDGSTLKVPFCNVFKLDDSGEKIREYLIYIDNSALFAPQA